jgi:lactate dehydrogenase-like 2-hydroxyacid dehydrogenase
MIDMRAMKKFDIRLGWTGGVNRRSVSELVLAFAIALLRHVPDEHIEVYLKAIKVLKPSQATVTIHPRK